MHTRPAICVAACKARGERRWLIAALAAASTATFQPFAYAQTSPLETAARDDGRIAFSIAPQPLASALTEFARQSGAVVLFPLEAMDGLRTLGVEGAFTPRDALERLLAETGYSAQINAAGEIQIRQIQPAPTIRRSSTQSEPPSDDPLEVEHTESASSQRSAYAEEIVVTGTRIRGTHPAGANLITVDREAIEESGRTTVQDVLASLPQSFPGSQNELTQLNSLAPGRNIAFGSTVDLRGLGADATLTLVNGRRLAPAGFGNFVDISAIPLAAVERIEVLADGASATYGSDAVGGVVNVILRSDFEGAETSLRYGAATQGGLEETGVAQVLGRSWAGGFIVGAYEFRDRAALANADRAFASDSDLTPFGGANFSRTNANPGNIIRIGTTPVSFAIPAGQDGTQLSEEDLIEGRINFQNGNEGAYLLPAQQSHSLFLSARQELAQPFEIFLDLLASERRAHTRDPQTDTIIVVPETNAYRQLNGLFPGAGPITIAYFFGDDLGPKRYETETRTLSLLGGAALELPHDWRIEASASYGAHADEANFANSLDSAALAPVLASADLQSAFNPFGDGSHTSPQALQGLTMSQELLTDSELAAYSLKADGAVFALPSGNVRAALGAERRVEAFAIDFSQRRASGVVNPVFVQEPARRTTDAVFFELFAPLLDENAQIPLVEALSISFSVRHEQSEDFGSSTTPKFGLRWALNSDLALRATWGESFKAPQFHQMLGQVGGTIASASALLDPFATNGSTGALQITGANRNLEPEEAETWTAGFDFTPSWAEGLQVQGAYFEIDFANRISIPGSVLDAFRHPENYEGFFIRNPTPEQIAAYLALADVVSGTIPPDGIEVIWDERLTNLASLKVRGVDLSARYTFTNSLGEFSLFMSASGLFEFARQANPALASSDQLDTMFNPIDWRGSAGLSWRGDSWRASARLFYADDYVDAFSVPNREIDSWTTIDLRIAREWRGAARDREPSGFEAALNVRNLFDENPPFANNPIGLGFDTINASPVGRVVSLELRRLW